MIANKTTQVPVAKTLGEIQAMLAKINASAMMINYEDQEPVSLSFQIVRGGRPLSFQLPSNWQGILAAMKRESTPQRLLNREQALRVSWRVVKDWLRAQLTLIEAGAATVEEVMIPWAITNDGTTVAKRLLTSSSSLLGLPAPKGGDA